jgi:hypothetical protein
MATNAAKAAGRVITAMAAGSPMMAKDDVIARRLAACLECPECVPFQKPAMTYHRCSKCGCWLDGKYFSKASVATETCPLGKWGAS